MNRNQNCSFTLVVQDCLGQTVMIWGGPGRSGMSSRSFKNSLNSGMNCVAPGGTGLDDWTSFHGSTIMPSGLLHAGP